MAQMLTDNALLTITQNGLYCPAGDFYIDPWQGVERAVITHAHADHARPGCRRYLAAAEGAAMLNRRLGDIDLQTASYGESIHMNGVRVSLHPAGHVLGSAQVRVEHRGEVWVASGDYKLEKDPTCTPFEPVRCHTFITESTFGLPIFKWQPAAEVLADINHWWRENARNAKTSLLFAYSLGKAQRILAGLDATIGPIFTHGAVEKMNACYRTSGVALPETTYVGAVAEKQAFAGGLVIAPPSGDDPAWYRKFPRIARGFASGWMTVRGNRRRRALDRGFVLSDHADWEGILSAIDASGAQNIWVTHGAGTALVRYLRERGFNAGSISAPLREDGEDD